MTPLLRLTIVCAVLAALCIGIDARMARAGQWLPALPPMLLGWGSTDAPLSPATLAYMDNPRAVQRVFHAPSGANIYVSLIAVNGIESFHDPTVCAAGSGFAQVDVQPAPLDNNGQVTARALGFQNGAARIVMCYWRQDRAGVCGVPTVARLAKPAEYRRGTPQLSVAFRAAAVRGAGVCARAARRPGRRGHLPGRFSPVAGGVRAIAAKITLPASHTWHASCNTARQAG